MPQQLSAADRDYIRSHRSLTNNNISRIIGKPVELVSIYVACLPPRKLQQAKPINDQTNKASKNNKKPVLRTLSINPNTLVAVRVDARTTILIKQGESKQIAINRYNRNREKYLNREFLR